MIQKLIIAVAMIGSMVAAPLVLAIEPVAAQSTAQGQKVCEGVRNIGGGSRCTTTGLTDLINRVVNILLFVIGAIAVIFIIIGGIRYVTSQGDQSAITSAKNTILYAVIGVVAAVAAYAIVNFVLANL